MSYQSELIDELRERAQVAEALLAKLTAEIDAKGGEVSAMDLLGMWDVARRRADAALVDVVALKTALASIASQLGGTVAGCSVESHCQVPKELAAVLAKVRGVAQMHADFACTNSSWTEGARRAGHAVLAVLPGMAG